MPRRIEKGKHFPSDVVVGEIRITSEYGIHYTHDDRNAEVKDRKLDQIECKKKFNPHPGWCGHIEREKK